MIVPELSYDGLAVSNGSAAMAAWKDLVELPRGEQKEALRKEMLEYCCLDTLAMVNIFQAMEELL